MTKTMIRGIMTLWLALVAAMVVLSLLPATAPPGTLGVDKMAHFTAFLGLASIPVAVLPRPAAACLALLFLIVLGGGIELAQAYIPGRQGSGADMLANGVGMVFGVAVGRLGAAAGRRIRLGRGVPNDIKSIGTVVPDPRGPGR